MSRIILLLALLLSAASVFAVEARVAIQTATTPAGANWNTHLTPNDETLSALKDFGTGSNTGWSIFFDEIGTTGTSSSGVNAVGTGAASWVDEAAISQEGHFFSVGANGYDLTFSGLNNGNTYTIEIFGNIQTTAGRVLSVTYDAVEQTLALQNNSTNIITISSVSPTAGQISGIQIRADDTSSGAALVQAVRIIETAGAGNLLLRRRRS